MKNRLYQAGLTPLKSCIAQHKNCFNCCRYWNDACLYARQSIGSVSTIKKEEHEIPVIRIINEKANTYYVAMSMRDYKVLSEDTWARSVICGRRVLSLEEIEFVTKQYEEAQAFYYGIKNNK